MKKEERDLTEEELEQAVGGRKLRLPEEEPVVWPRPTTRFPKVTSVEPLNDPVFGGAKR